MIYIVSARPWDMILDMISDLNRTLIFSWHAPPRSVVTIATYLLAIAWYEWFCWIVPVELLNPIGLRGC